MARMVRVIDAETGAVVCERCELAETPWRRLRGLMGRARPPWNHGLMVRPAASIHTCFMRFPIDAVFLDSEMRVLRVHERLRPWRASATRGARAVLELPARDRRWHHITVGQTLRTLDPARAEDPAVFLPGAGR